MNHVFLRVLRFWWRSRGAGGERPSVAGWLETCRREVSADSVVDVSGLVDTGACWRRCTCRPASGGQRHAGSHFTTVLFTLPLVTQWARPTWLFYPSSPSLMRVGHFEHLFTTIGFSRIFHLFIKLDFVHPFYIFFVSFF